GVGRREHLEASRGVGGDQAIAGGPHRRVDGVARAERLAAALAGAVAGVERVAALDRGLHRALLGREQPIADGEGAGLVELDLLVHHATFAGTGPTSRSRFSATGTLFRVCASRSSWRWTMRQS